MVIMELCSVAVGGTMASYFFFLYWQYGQWAILRYVLICCGIVACKTLVVMLFYCHWGSCLILWGPLLHMITLLWYYGVVDT